MNGLKSADLKARVQGEELNQLFEDLLKGQDNASTVAQYNAYMNMLNLALKTNSFIFTYDANDEGQMLQLRKFLTSTGYNNDIRDLEEETPVKYFSISIVFLLLLERIVIIISINNKL